MIVLSQDQSDAVDVFLDFLTNPDEKVMILEGSAGNGKSFLVSHLINVANKHLDMLGMLLNEDKKLNYVLTATTNKAAKVLGAATHREATTIHSFLGLYVDNDYQTGKQYLKKTKSYAVKQNVLLVIDESSMVDTNLLRIIQEATFQCKVLFVGDPYQLPPVFEPGSPVFSNQEYVSAKLTTIHRQQANNHIITLSSQFKQSVETGLFAPIYVDNKNTFWLTGEEFKNKVIENYTQQTNSDENKILCFTNEKVNAYNKFIRDLFNTCPAPYVSEQLISNGIIKSAGTAKAFIGNDELITIMDVNPGSYKDIPGYDVSIKGENSNWINAFIPENFNDVTAYLKILAKNKNWLDYFMAKDYIADLRPPYASTIHKAQGSTYKNVFIDLTDIGKCKVPNQIARLLYVAISRASDNVYFYGELPDKFKG